MDPKARNKTAAANLGKAKEMATRVVSLCGAGDWVGVYTVGTGFSEQRNMLVNGGVVPVPRSFRHEPVRRKALEHGDALSMLRAGETAAGERGWLSLIQNVQQEPPEGQSNYLAAFDYLAKRLTSTREKQRQVEVIALGDLEQLPMPASRTPPEPDAAYADAFAGVHIRLAYPYRVPETDKVRHADIESFWRRYFEERGASDITIAPFGDGAEIPPALGY
jgi:hypothetical protein